MNTLDDKLEKIAATAASELGYSVLNWGTPTLGGKDGKTNTHYKPEVQKEKNGKVGEFISINLYSDGGISIYDHTGDSEGAYIPYEAETEYLGVSEAKSEYSKELEQKKEETFKNIIKSIDFKSYKEAKKHPLYVSKKLKPSTNSQYCHEMRLKYTELFTDKEIDFIVPNAAIIPFYREVGGKVVGVQYRTLELEKKTIKYSAFRGAFHILQEGEYNNFLGKTLGYLTESYTTACEIAEAMPEAFVACTAGIKLQADVYKKLSKHYGSKMCLIAVLDKTEGGIPSKTELDILKDKDIFTMQLNKFKSELDSITDYNEFALKFGKSRLQQEVYRDTMKVFPKLPEVLSYSDGKFKVVSAIHGNIESVEQSKIKEKLDIIMNENTQDMICAKLGKLDADVPELIKDVKNIWLDDISEQGSRIARGLGIFKDDTKIVANVKDGRFMVDEKGKVRSIVDMKPVSNNIYIPIADKGKRLETGKLSQKDLDELMTTFTSTYTDGVEEDTYSANEVFWFMTGFCVQGLLSGLSEHRAHLWTYGDSGTGKTKIRDYFIVPLCHRIGESSIDASSSGIDQKLSKNGELNAVMFALDECGDDTAEKRKRVTGLVNLARELATSDGADAKLRGSASQHHKDYNRTAALSFSSTENNLLKDYQDISRFLILDTNKLRLNKINLNNLRDITKKLADKFVYTTIESSRAYLAVYELFRKYLTKEAEVRKLPEMSHKLQALTSVLAAASAIRVTLKIDTMDNTVENTTKLFTGMIDFQLESQLDKAKLITNEIDNLLMTPFRYDQYILSPTLKQFIKEFKSYDGIDMWRDFGVYINKADRLVVSLKRFDKVQRLFDNYAVKKGVILSKANLVEEQKHRTDVSKYQLPSPDKKGKEYALVFDALDGENNEEE